MTSPPETLPGYTTLVLSVDDLEWTKHWLGDYRCDQLIVWIARKPNLNPRVRIRAIESKSSSASDAIEPTEDVNPFEEGIRQVTATLDALWELLDPRSPNPLVEDLRFTALIEQIAAAALSELVPLRTSDTEALIVLRTISDLSLRSLGAGAVALDGAVVCTQYHATVPHRVREIYAQGDAGTWRLYLVRAGTPEIDTLLGSNRATLNVEPAATAQKPSDREPAKANND